MEDVLVDLAKRGVKVVLVDILKQPRYMLERIDIIPNLVPKEQIFKTFKKAIQWIKENVKE
jgi:SulP family sulfate permease